jgi:hypothetical protein
MLRSAARTVAFLAFAMAIPSCLVPAFPPKFPSADVQVNISAAPPASAFNQVIARNGSHVYVAWVDVRNGTSDIYFRSSEDFGQTWGVSDRRINHNPAGQVWVAQPQLLALDDIVYVVWVDSREGKGAIWMNFSKNGGATWRPHDIRVDHAATGYAQAPQLCGSGDDLYVVWSDDRSGGLTDIYFNRSSNGGHSWMRSDVRLNTNPAGTADARLQSIACSGSHVYCAWQDTRVTGESFDIFFNSSSDGGQTWGVSDHRLETDVPGVGSSNNVRLAASGASVHAVWFENRDGAYDIRYNHSGDFAATWQSADTRLDGDAPGAADSFVPEIAVEGSRVSVVWYDRRSSSPELPNEDIYFNRSVDGGATWVGEVRLNTSPAGSASAENPTVCVSGPYVFAAWMDERSGVSAIRLNASSDGGATWLPSDLQLNTGSGRAEFPKLSCQGTSVYAVWTDYRNNAIFSDIFFTASTP